MVLFKNRREAGEKLSEELERIETKYDDLIAMGIPRGGVPVGSAVAKRLGCPLDVIVLRKLPIPENPEAGFGAVTLNRKVILNEKLMSRYYIPREITENIVNQVYDEVLRRNRIYRNNAEEPDLREKTAIITDDGLASGYTMLAAIEYARSCNAGEVIAATPVAHRGSYELVREKADQIVVPHISEGLSFAVASFYEEFPEMEDEEVISLLRKTTRSIKEQ